MAKRKDCNESSASAADIASAVEGALVGGATICDNIVSQVLSMVRELLERSDRCACDCETTIGESAANAIDHAERVTERQNVVVVSQAASWTAEAERIIADLESKIAGEPPEPPPAPPVVHEPSMADEPPTEPEAATEAASEPDEPATPEPLPPPATPKIVIASTAETLLITQCRSDLYSGPEVATRATQAAARWMDGLGGAGAPSGFSGIVRMLAGSLADVPVIGEALAELADNSGGVVDNVIRSLANALGCTAGSGMLIPVEGVAQAFAQYVAPNIGEVSLPLTYARRSLCPTRFPSSAQAIGAFLGNAIDEPIARSWLSINNDCWEPQQAVIRSQRSKLTAGEILSLHLRGHLSPEQFTTRLRELGYLDNTDYADIKELGRWLVPPSDQIRLMVRDAFRTKIVERFGMDDLFTDAFTEESQKMAAEQGIRTGDMRLLWRAHWGIPAPGQLFNMVHRLPYVDDEFISLGNQLLRGMGSSATLSRKDFEPAAVQRDVFDALVQQDILPFWIPRLLSLTFRPLSRRELQMSGDAGVITSSRLLDAYRELGVNQANAQLLTRLAERRRDLRAPSVQPVRLFKKGVISKTEAAKRMPEFGLSDEVIRQTLDDAAAEQKNHEAIQLYKRNAISRLEAEKRLEDHGILPGLFKRWLDDVDRLRTNHIAVDRYRDGTMSRADAERAMEAQGVDRVTIHRLIGEVDETLSASLMKYCATALEKRFLLGELTIADLERDLGGLGMAPHLVAWWRKRAECKRGAIGKHVPVSRLSKWLTMGIIAAPDFVRRLMRIGWDRDDAMDALTEITRVNEERVAKAKLREARKAVAEQEKNQKDIDRKRAASDKQINQLVRAREALAKAREKREKRTVEAADKLRAALAIELPAALAMARRAIEIGERDYGLAPDERIDALETAIRRWPDESDADFISRYRQVAAGREVAEQFA